MLFFLFQPLQTEPVDLSVKKSSPAHWYDEMGEPENDAAANLRLGFRGLSYIKKGESCNRIFMDDIQTLRSADKYKCVRRNEHTSASSRLLFLGAN